MKLTAAIKFQLLTCLKATLVFYAIVYLICFIAGVATLTNGSKYMLNGIEFNTCVFIIFIGFYAFEDDFKFLLQNGCTRKTMLKSLIVQFGALTFVLAFIDSMNAIVLSNFFKYTSIFQQYYGLELHAIWSFLWSFSLYFMIVMISYFLTVCIKRMNKTQKLISFIGLPAIILTLYPIIELQITKGAITENLTAFVRYILGLSDGINMLIPLACFSAFVVIFTILIYFCTRRATIK